jgi:serine/threonine-protein kinase
MGAAVGTSPDALVDYTRRVARELCEQTAFAEGRAQAEAPASLMHGAAGIATFLAEVSRTLDEPDALEGAERWLRLGREVARTSSPSAERGLSLGRPGLSWASVLVADAAGDRARRARAIRAFADTVETAPAISDLTRGRAGFAEASRQLLATLADLTRGDKALLERVATQCETHAFKHARIEPRDVRSLGVAHGLAGMLLVLLGSNEHREFAAEQAERVASLRRRLCDRLSYFPMHDGRRPGRLPGSWCNGMPGMLQLYLRADTLYRTPILRRALIASGETVARLPEENPSLCCGSAGRALFLFDLATSSASNVAPWTRRAGELLESAMRAAPHLPPRLFQGKVGIAWTCLAAALPTARRPLFFARG